MSSLRVVLVVAVLCFARRSEALFQIVGSDERPEMVPVERLQRNLEAYLGEHPNDAGTIYALGRLHYYSFTHPSASSGVDSDEYYAWQERVAEVFRRPDLDTGHPTGIVTSESLGHLQSGISFLRKATELAPAEALYWNTLAAALQEGAEAGPVLQVSNGLPPGDEALEGPVTPQDRAAALELAAQRLAKVHWDAIEGRLFQTVCRSTRVIASTVLPPLLPDDFALREDLGIRCWRERAIAAYLRAFVAANVETWARGGLGADWHDPRLIAEEATTAIQSLVDERGVRSDDRSFLDDVEAFLALSYNPDLFPPVFVTPIILSTLDVATFPELLSRATVSFNLDGAGAREWSWVKPSTGILVWDPERCGQISSGFQLFGNVSFHLFWRNGYSALDALDDDRDGWLAGSELQGLAVWFDRNTNGVSDAGEVVPVGTLNIVGLATHEDGRDGEAWVAAKGVRFGDGRVLPTYDWVAHSEVSVTGGFR